MIINQGQLDYEKFLDLGIDIETLSPKNYAHLFLYSWANEQIPGGVIVDAGCEMGFGMQMLLRQDRKVLGIDIDLISLSYSSHRSNAQDHIIHICADLIKIPMENNSCNGICLINTIHLLTKPCTLLKECQRVLINGCPLIVAIPLDYNLPEHWQFPTIKTRFSAIVEEVFSYVEYPQIIFEVIGLSGDIIQNSMSSFFLTAICHKL